MFFRSLSATGENGGWQREGGGSRLHPPQQAFEPCVQNKVNPRVHFAPYIFNTMSTKNSVPLLEAFAEPPYFSAVAAMAESPIPFPLRFVER